MNCWLGFTREAVVSFDDGRLRWLRDWKRGLVSITLLLGEELRVGSWGFQCFGPVLLTIFESLKIGTEPAVVERGALYTSLFDALLSHINHVLVQALVDVGPQVQFLSNRVQHGIFLLVYGARTFLRNSWLCLLHVADCDVPLLLSQFFIAGMELELSKALCLLIDALLLNVGLVDGFGRRVPDFRHHRSFANRHAVLVDQLNQETALGVAHVRILLLDHVMDVFISDALIF